MNKILLPFLEDDVCKCTLCDLCHSRTNAVFGEGNTNANVMFIGEAPGQVEDEQARPFVGKSGRLLSDWLQKSNLDRNTVYITNIVKCHPPNNRDPEDQEVEACRSYLEYQINCIDPVVIITLGRVAITSLMGDKNMKITKIRGNQYRYNGVTVIPTYHPSFVLRQRSEENENKVLSDFSLAKSLINNKKGSI